MIDSDRYPNIIGALPPPPRAHFPSTNQKHIPQGSGQLQDGNLAGSGPVQSQISRAARVFVIESEGEIVAALEIVLADARAGIALVEDGQKVAAEVLDDEDGAGAGSVEDEVVLAARVAGVEAEGFVQRGFEVVAADAGARVALLVDGVEEAVAVLEDPECARVGAVERDVIVVSAAVVVEGERAIFGALEIVAADAAAWVALRIHWLEGAVSVPEDCERAGAGAIEDNMVLLSGMIVIEGESKVVGRFQIVATDPTFTSSIARPKHAGEVTIGMFDDGEDPGAGAVKTKMVEITAVIIVKSKPPISSRFEIIATDTLAPDLLTRIPLLIDRSERTTCVFQNPNNTHSWPS